LSRNSSVHKSPLRTSITFHTTPGFLQWENADPRPTPIPENHLLSAVRESSFITFAAILHMWEVGTETMKDGNVKKRKGVKRIGEERKVAEWGT
jgi:hypothetical protein